MIRKLHAADGLGQLLWLAVQKERERETTPGTLVQRGNCSGCDKQVCSVLDCTLEMPRLYLF